MVSVARNRYSVPCKLPGQMVSTRLYPSNVAVVAEDAVVARHERLSAPGGTRYDWPHCIPLTHRSGGLVRERAVGHQSFRHGGLLQPYKAWASPMPSVANVSMRRSPRAGW